MVNNGKPSRLVLKMSGDLLRRVESIAASMNLTPGAVVEMAVERIVDAPDPREEVAKLVKDSPRRSADPREVGVTY